ncbi:Adenosylmethionine-8-amino-7-oxononanoate aminotransferase [Nitrosotalea devaniterrae]|uniref:Adenosylmethionine-8-amino-7-oxononanoate aminotransferase n=1 Tax=Nitrosotalea devaniterrae TaxID=1078905 RepID=A0A128A2Y6_9ARCH|nr:Adenosylmethionine-8-amino-7-oxononanoate aminotransferase [Candidatus Nitrosotalea devanaterra]
MRSFVWHPYTQMNDWEKFDVISKGKGMWLYDKQGNALMDGVASMWCNVWGHSNKELTDSIIKQTKNLQHSSLFNLTNDKAEDLAEKLVKLAPEMHRVFYSDDGSTAMEISAKMALQYWNNIGEKKTRFVSLENGYHGDTIGAMSLGYVPLFFSKFKSVLFQVLRTPTPNRYRIPKGYSFEDYQEFCLEKIEQTFSKNDDIAAFVMESGAQIAGGVVIYPKGFQKKISKMCKKHNVLLILDEIATGFGRLGSMIEYQKQESTPDIVSFGKMLSGGYLPLAATLASKKIYDSFLGEYQDMKHFFHGHTFTGNPLACATALRNISLYKKYNLISKIKKRAIQMELRIKEISSLDMVGDVRHAGMLMGIELVSDKKKKTPISPTKKLPQKIFVEAKKHGIYQRTLGPIVMLVPPLAISEKELGFLLDGTIKTIKNVSSQT